ncbi:MAG: site-specific integrase [Verrucomicrobiia bacterium]
MRVTLSFAPHELFKPPQSDFWHVEIITEDGSNRTLNTFCTTREEAEAVVRTAKVRELETASKAHRLTSDVVTLITANRTMTVADSITEWDQWLKVTSRSERTRTNNVITVRQWAREMSLEVKTVGSVTTDHIHRWINRPHHGDKRGTRLMKLSAIRNLFRFCGLKR